MGDSDRTGARMTETDQKARAASEGGGRLRRNLAILSARLKRRRIPALLPDAYPRTRLLLAGGLLAVIVITLSLFSLDSGAPDWSEALSPLTEGVFQFITQFGKSGWYLVPVGIFGLVLLFADWTRIGRSAAAAWVEVADLVGFFFFNMAAAGIVTNLIKWTLGRSRPLRFKKDGIFTFEPISFAHEHVSFPSGHATTAAALFVSCAYIFRGRPVVVGVIGVCAGLMAVSRVAVGAHFPSDVVAGVFVGAAFTVFYAYALGRSGVAFQRQPDGSLMPKTVAIRTMFRREGAATMVEELWAALRGARRG